MKAKLGKRPCLFQLKIAKALAEDKKDVENEDKLIIVVTPLNLLGKQNVNLLTKANISGVAIEAENSSDETFKDVAAGKY
ncbi:hypothetical protein JAAARDRAFT_189778 [Jaapia argillacea MUCL 33604]|uniref:Uncharacterized protein n=1 Tax=Jaapia argillacea MUCL 33604 TaxID=933084 RepID=A0A067Q682_9AGAM|nr:hypothetical protein JAAARDRAFT_189778 [Jaapia argillacea MUCL 33604]